MPPTDPTAPPTAAEARRLEEENPANRPARELGRGATAREGDAGAIVDEADALDRACDDWMFLFAGEKRAVLGVSGRLRAIAGRIEARDRERGRLEAIAEAASDPMIREAIEWVCRRWGNDIKELERMIREGGLSGGHVAGAEGTIAEYRPKVARLAVLLAALDAPADAGKETPC